MLRPVAVALASFVTLSAVFAESTLTIHTDQPGKKISPMLFGIFFEEINHAGDGGLYAEKIRNRSFEESDNPEGWKDLNEVGTKAALSIQSTPRSEFNRRSLKVVTTIDDTNRKPRVAGVSNGGFWGIGVHAGESYDVTFIARGESGFTGPVTVCLFKTYRIESQPIELTAEWKEYKVTLTATQDDPSAELGIVTSKSGAFSLDYVSMFPTKTFNNRPNGLRVDLADKLVDMKPAFMRFPGGCWVEGETLANSMHWKQTIGPLAERRTLVNLWRYQSPNGLGYHEYLLLCEDLKAEPLFVFNCGMSHKETVPMDKMAPLVQDALDAIEYANGDASTKYGAMRIAAGHPAPFNLKYVEVGNENGGPKYNERYALFIDAIKAKHPQMRTVACLWGGKPSSRPIDLLDEHYYHDPKFFLDNADRYDAYDRGAHKVYVGEYAVTEGPEAGKLGGALGEAAFMIGMERNSDVVEMASYAPLFANVNDIRWKPDAIYFDSTRSVGTPSYHAQKMFGQALGETTVPVELKRQSAESKPVALHGGVGVGTWATKAEFKDLQFTPAGESQITLTGDEKTDRGEWAWKDGVITQTSDQENAKAFFLRNGKPGVFTVKARKTEGKEGFLIFFNVGAINDFAFWNIGGWGNTHDAIQIVNEEHKSSVSKDVPRKIETGRWYDIKVELGEDRVKCYLDDKLAYDLPTSALKVVPPVTLHAGATKAANGDWIVKVVNYAGNAEAIKLDIVGVTGTLSGEKTTLTSGSLRDENTLDEPNKVEPKLEPVSFKSGDVQTFAPRSLTVLKLKASK